jgi:hypothetical protein
MPQTPEEMAMSLRQRLDLLKQMKAALEERSKRWNVVTDPAIVDRLFHEIAVAEASKVYFQE